LKAGIEYYFWVEVGEELAGSIASKEVGLPADKIPEGARLRVSVGVFPDGFELDAGVDDGEIEMLRGGFARVTAQPKGAPRAREGVDLRLDRRLYFRVRGPERLGDASLRCSFYYGSVLVQSWLVRATLAANEGAPGRLVADLDYNLSVSLRADQLKAIGAHDFSMMVNGDGDGPGATHQFRFRGAGDFRSDVTLSDLELQELIKAAREQLRFAAWGSEGLWDGKLDRYRYSKGASFEQFRDDLFNLARVGFRFFFQIERRLERGSKDAAVKLREVLRPPGVMQFASTRSVREFFPLSVVARRR
jgi:hypothetical protein